LWRWASVEALDSLGGTAGGVLKVQEEPEIETDPCFTLGLELFLNLLAIEDFGLCVAATSPII
jgi:hypothetical protein